MQYRLEIPASDGDVAVRAFVERWLEQDALRALVEDEGGTWPRGDLATRVDALHRFSDRWDFRAGGERLDIGRASGERDGRAILERGAQLGMVVADRPAAASYDHAIVLGGTALGSIYRVRRLFELRDNGIAIGDTAGLTALRELQAGELDLVRERPDIAPIVVDAGTEFDVMTRAVEHFAGGHAEVTLQPDPNPYLASATAVIGNTTVLAAPSADPARRANTRDNYDVYVDRVQAGDSVLVVTSSIYLPYQIFIAIQALGWDKPKTIEAVGFPPQWMDGILTGPENVLQELRSALFGAQRTLRALGDGD